MDEMVYDDLMSERRSHFWLLVWLSIDLCCYGSFFFSFFFILSFFWCFAEGFSVLFLGFLWKNTVMIYKEKRWKQNTNTTKVWCPFCISINGILFFFSFFFFFRSKFWRTTTAELCGLFLSLFPGLGGHGWNWESEKNFLAGWKWFYGREDNYTVNFYFYYFVSFLVRIKKFEELWKSLFYCNYLCAWWYFFFS